ncbi:class I adenylate-forming enzyme family protein [Parasphingorhabdus pacifica]
MPTTNRNANNLADLVTSATSRGPGHPALIEAASGLALTWRQLDSAVNREVARLRAMGIRAGDRVALRMGNSAAFCIGLFGVLRAGGIAVPFSPKVPAGESYRILADCGARALIADDELVGDPLPAGVDLLRSPDAACLSEPGQRFEAPTGGEDTALISFTSGTSGPPRGAMLSHRALLANARQSGRLRPMPVNAADRALLALPMFHLYGLGPGLLQVAMVGATAVLLPRFAPEQALEAIDRYRVTTVIGVPPMYEAWLRLSDEQLREGMATVRLLHSGAAPLGAEVAQSVRAATGLDVFEGYGLIETGPVLATSLASGEAKPGSVGRALPGVELRLVDDSGNPLPGRSEAPGWRGTAGRIQVRGANLFSGYWPDGRDGPDAEGWMHTGDLGFFDGDGDLHVVDRTADVIRIGAVEVYPHEVEDVLRELPGVADAAAIASRDEVGGGAVKVLIVLVVGAELTRSEVREHCRARLAEFKVPMTVEFTSELAYSPTGKLVRRVLRS